MKVSGVYTNNGVSVYSGGGAGRVNFKGGGLVVRPLAEAAARTASAAAEEAGKRTSRRNFVKTSVLALGALITGAPKVLAKNADTAVYTGINTLDRLTGIETERAFFFVTMLKRENPNFPFSNFKNLVADMAEGIKKAQNVSAVQKQFSALNALLNKNIKPGNAISNSTIIPAAFELFAEAFNGRVGSNEANLGKGVFSAIYSSFKPQQADVLSKQFVAVIDNALVKSGKWTGSKQPGGIRWRIERAFQEMRRNALNSDEDALLKGDSKLEILFGLLSRSSKPLEPGKIEVFPKQYMERQVLFGNCREVAMNNAILLDVKKLAYLDKYIKKTGSGFRVTTKNDAKAAYDIPTEDLK